ARLIRDLPAAGGATAEEAVLAAFATAVAKWCGGDRVLVELEGHGRQALFDDVDLSHTVGWFTSIYPVAPWAPPGREPEAVPRSIRAQLRAVPDRGIGYGLLRYLSPDAELRESLACLPEPEIVLNYTGHGSIGGGVRQRFSLPPQGLGGDSDPDRPRPRLLQVTIGAHGDQLHAHWGYSGAVHDEATITALAEDFIAELSDIVRQVCPRRQAIAVPAPTEAMQGHGVPATAVAVIEDGELTGVHNFGVLRAG